MKATEGNTISLQAAQVLTLADLGEDTRANLAAGFPLAWHDGHVTTADHVADWLDGSGELYYCHACGDLADGFSGLRLLLAPEAC